MIYLLLIFLGLQPPPPPPPVEPVLEISVCDTLDNLPYAGAPPPPEPLVPVDYSHCLMEENTVIIYDPPALDPPPLESDEIFSISTMFEVENVIHDAMRPRFQFRWQVRK